MASLLSPRRTDPDLALTATVARTERVSSTAAEHAPPPASWLLVAVAGALASALIGWILVTGLCVLAWLTASSGSLAGALRVGTGLWLLANGAGAQLGSTSVTLVPYGASLLFALVLSRFVAFSARYASPPGARDPRLAGPRAWLLLGAVSVVSYAVPVVVASAALGSGGPTASSAVGVAVVLAVAAARGSSRGLGYRPTAGWLPVWRAVARAVLAAQLVLVLAGAVALATGLVLHLDRVSAVTAALRLDWSGGLVLLLAQVAVLPNAVAWSTSYVLGAGFSLGPGAVVAPVATHLGLLPSVPLLAAVPRPASGATGELWWLAGGVLAGMLAAWLALRAAPHWRLDVSALVAGLTGVASGLVFTALAWLSGGDLGSTRLAGLGPRLLPLLVLSVSTLGLSGLVSGLGVGLVGRFLVRRRARTTAANASSPEASRAG